jgi:hypothetical protein
MPSESQATGHQDWGTIIGVGVVALGVVVIAVNLFGCGAPILSARLYEEVAIPYSWVQAGRLAGLLVGLGGGGWLLGQLLRQRRASGLICLKTSLQQAIGYTRRIEELLETDPSEHQRELLVQIRTWQRTIRMMVNTLTDLDRSEAVIGRDLRHLPGLIVDLERQLALETDPLLCADLEQILIQRKRQRLALEQLQVTRRRAEIQVERTTAVLGTIYSQLLTYRSTFHVADYEQLADNVGEEVQHLQDCLETLHNWTPDSGRA